MVYWAATKVAMAEFLWRNRKRVAAAALLGGSATLALLDAIARPDEPALVWIGFVLLAFTIVGASLDLDRWGTRGQLIPPLLVVLLAGLAVLTAGSASTAYAPVGLSILVSATLVYIGFVIAPGWALVVSPILLGALFLAKIKEPERITLALPLLAVPVSVLLAELVAMLTSRAERDAHRSSVRLQRLTQLEDVLRRFRRPGSITQAAHQVAEAALEIFGVERSTVVLRDSTGQLIPVSLGPVSKNEPDDATAGLVAETINGDEPKIVPTGTNGNMLVLPLPAAEAPAGAVLVYPVPADDPEFTLDLARLFGVQIGISIEHLYVIDELAKESTRDALTGIGNRRHADKLLESLQPGDALVLLDLDFLKTVNDTLGHAAGDQVLQELSAHLQHCLRDSDMSARLGGDEFLIVARRAHADPLAVADRVLSGWQGKGGLTTLSAGVALHQAQAETADTFDRADSALYQAKAAGKDQACLWSRSTAKTERRSGLVD